MKNILFLLIFAISSIMAFAQKELSSFRGVWANDSAEAVVTDAVCIFFAKSGPNMIGVLDIPSDNYHHRTVFGKDGSVTTETPEAALEIQRCGDMIEIGGERLKKIEDIEIVEPYEMTECRHKFDVGKCLQEWRLGTSCGLQENMPYCEINTNRHMFVYMINPSMVYIRAAATRNNNNGTLFFQNIRMMKNQNTGEYTLSIVPHNLDIAGNDLEIDNSKFSPDKCTFNPDGGIYWSLISFSPDLILLNGCGETYRFERPTKDSHLNEWIKYNPYAGADSGIELLKQPFK